ncbi:MAG: acyl-CoA dehydrogenase family protein [Actinobacteria bacterium]|nr:acyl-CoA dehydrogenase family protein [Actinomycetota bacterium]
MDLNFTIQENEFRDECRTWLEENIPRSLPSGDTREGFALHLEWERLLFSQRWSVVSWPEKYGGRDASPMEWLIFEEEYYRAGGPQRITQNGIFLLAPTVFSFGTPEQQNQILPRMAAAQDLWCQGWSEPNAGSDLASTRSKAERDLAGGWRLTGQKTWTTRGAFCTHLFGLFRSDPDSERHHGLTYFLVPLDAPGVTVRGFGRLDGDEGFAEVFLDDVYVPEEAVLGEVNKGWGVAMATASAERGLTLRSPGRFTASAARLVDLYREQSSNANSDLRDSVVQAVIEAEAYRWQTFSTVTRMTDGENIGAEASMTKVFWSELDLRIHEVALAILGPTAEFDDTGWMKGFEFALSGPIYAGTNEIQRNVIAERVLGLPRK